MFSLVVGNVQIVDPAFGLHATTIVSHFHIELDERITDPTHPIMVAMLFLTTSPMANGISGNPDLPVVIKVI
ncbi:MAG: hypothetical protein IH793_10485 [Acidobacteria bacterium]|nr:hypothetical protein [Acidobacteriota bacterium]